MNDTDKADLLIRFVEWINARHPDLEPLDRADVYNFLETNR